MSLNLQFQIKKNANDINQYVKDLYEWEDHVNKKTNSNIKPQAQKQQASQPIRGQADTSIEGKSKQSERGQQQEELNKTERLKRDGNTIADYYRAWDNYNPEKELEKVEKGDEVSMEKTVFEKSKIINKTIAKPRQQIVIKGGRKQVADITCLKEKANLHYNNKDFRLALEGYTECLKQLDAQDPTKQENELRSVLYNNRGQTYIKIEEFATAEKDFTESINQNPKNGKAFFRRAQCKKKLKLMKEALLDLEQAYSLMPDDPETKKELIFLKKKVEQKKLEAKKNMQINQRFSSFESNLIKVQDIQQQSSQSTKVMNQQQQNFETNQSQQKMNENDNNDNNNNNINDNNNINKNNNNDEDASIMEDSAYFRSLKSIDKKLKHDKIQQNEGVNVQKEGRKSVRISGELIIDSPMLKSKPNLKAKPEKPILQNDIEDEIFLQKLKGNIDGAYHSHDYIQKHEKEEEKLSLSSQEEDGDEEHVHFGQVEELSQKTKKAPVVKKQPITPKSILRLENNPHHKRFSAQLSSEQQFQIEQNSQQQQQHLIDDAKQNLQVMTLQDVKDIQNHNANIKPSHFQKGNNKQQVQIKNVAHFRQLWSQEKESTEFLKIHLLEELDRNNLKEFFKEELDVQIILEILKCLNEHIGEYKELAAEYLLNLPKVKRFELSMKFLLEKEKQDLKQLVSVCSKDQEEIQSLYSAYLK